MPKKLSDETIYMKVDGKMKPIGKLYDRDHIGYGTYFVTNTKYGRSMSWISAAPDPDFIKLETAIYECRDDLTVSIREIISEFINDHSYYKHDYHLIEKIIQSIRKTYLDKKKKMLDIIGQ